MSVNSPRVMVTFYCSCVFIDDPAHIPTDERVFYAFMIGILLREVLEFWEFMPAWRIITSDHDMEKCTWMPPHRIVSALSRQGPSGIWPCSVYFDQSTDDGSIYASGTL